MAAGRRYKPPPAATVDRIAIRAPGADHAAGRRLGELVAQRLTPPPVVGGGAAAIGRLHVELAQRAGETPESLAARIADHVSHLIAGAAGGGGSEGGR